MLVSDMLGKIIEESLRADIGMLRRWPTVCWAAYRAADRIWPGIIRSGLTSIFAGDVEAFEQYVSSGGTETAGLRYDIYVGCRPLRLSICVAGRGGADGEADTWYAFEAMTQADRVLIQIDPQGHIMSDARRVEHIPLYHALVKIFPDLLGA